MDDMKLTIKGLFGHFDYEIPLYGLSDADSFPVSDGVTILTGPNGYGKTTILRVLEAISKGDLDFFAKLNFENLTLYTGKGNLIIEKEKYGLEVNNVTVTFDDIKPYMSTVIHNPPEINLKHSDLGACSDVVLNGDISNSHIVINVDTSSLYDESLSPNCVSTTKGVGKGISEAESKTFADIYSQMTESMGRTFMIREQRLIEPTPSGIRDVVKGIAQKLQSRFSGKQSEYSSKSTELDSSFPYRLLEQPSENKLTKDEFGRFYQDMNYKLRTLQENGLSDAVQRELPAFQTDKAGILRIFFDDFNEKYKVYEPLVRKLTLFRKILDRRFRRFKCVEISREYGLRVRDSGGDVIPLEKLSSGEQETLVLYYQLIFETAPGTMLLIDEPEISLHIAWQRHFIDELKEIVRLNGLRAVVATHSTSIIGRHRDIQVDLGALYQDELDRQRAQQG